MKLKIEYQRATELPDWLLKEVGGDRLLASLLIQRGMKSPEDVRSFLDPTFFKPTAPAEFPGMERAVAMVLAAVREGKRVCVYGDYDVDGVTATVILVTLFRKLGGIVTYHLPDRFKEGYGINQEVIKGLAGRTDLIISCDCGISNYREVALARELGMEVLVTDHHQLPAELPPAEVILSPLLLEDGHQARQLPGAGMAYFLAAAVLNSLQRVEESREFLDLVALAVVADVVPLLGENRFLLQTGLPVLARTERIGLQQLFKVSGLQAERLIEEDIAFRLAPLLNSAGRLVHARLAAELLLTEQPQEAGQLAGQLVMLNQRRKQLQAEIIAEARQLIGAPANREGIVLYQPHWHQGVLGIAAGRLAEDLQLPVILMSLKDDNCTVTGSARSIPAININQQLKKTASFLEKFGGHAGAAGFSLRREQLTPFSLTIGRILKEEVEQLTDQRIIRVDQELELAEVSLQTYHQLRKLAPFGEQNPKPRFLCYQTEVIARRTLSNKQHQKLVLSKNGVEHHSLWWWSGQREVGREIDLVYTIDLSYFSGQPSLQLLVEEAINRETVVETVKGRVREAAAALEILDYRQRSKQEIAQLEETGSVYFWEGLKKPERLQLINRYQLTRGKTLVLLSCPPALDILKELILVLAPLRLILAYQGSEPGRSKDFLTRLVGLLKYSIKEKDGLVDLYQLAVLTEQLESTVLLGLKYLQARGLIRFEHLDPRRLLVTRDSSGQLKGRTIFRQGLSDLLQETMAFRRFMLDGAVSKIKKLLS